MSPRSREFMEVASRRLGGARSAAASDAGTALSAAYYAMLYAARAALSERDHYAKTHHGTWTLFGREFVDTAEFDPDLFRAARAMQPRRERSDYDAWLPSEQEVRAAIELGQRFVDAVDAMLR